VAEFQVHLNDAAIYDMLNGADGPVAEELDRMSERAAAVARATVRVRHNPSRGFRSTAFPPGYTLTSIHANVHWYNGLIYGGVAAVEEPTIFLEDPAEQMNQKYPFLSIAFDSLEPE
jgi:hypothetical protein